MPWVVTILLLAWPAVEIAVFIQVSRWVGLLPAVAGIILSGMAGMALLRNQGLATAQRAQKQLNSGQMPVAELFDGACLAVAGILFMLPGFVTDLLGFPLLIPPLRRWLRRLLAARLQAGRGGGAGATVIEGEWEVVRREDEGGEPPPKDGGDSPSPRLPPRSED